MHWPLTFPTVLESWLDYTGELEPPEPLARLPQLKRRMKRLLTQLDKVQQIAQYSSTWWRQRVAATVLSMRCEKQDPLSRHPVGAKKWKTRINRHGLVWLLKLLLCFQFDDNIIKCVSPMRMEHKVTSQMQKKSLSDHKKPFVVPMQL